MHQRTGQSLATTPGADRRRPRIALVTPWRFDDPHAWSGMIPRIYSALSDVADVVPLSTAEQQTSVIDRAAAKALGLVSRRGYLWDFGLATSAARGRALRRRIRATAPDVVVAVVASTDIAFLGDVNAPIVQVTDATFDAIHGFYPMFSNLHPLSSAQAEIIAERSARATAMFVASSQWAIDSLVHDYAVGTHQCVLAPTGPGVAPPSAWQREARSGPLRALLVASNWQRKGGDVAVDAVRRARARGVPASLTVVGDAPAGLPEWVSARGRLDAAALSTEYQNADVLLELTSANAAGVTLTDAAAHGLPVIATRVGGVGSIVLDGATGVLVKTTDASSSTAFAERAADALATLQDPSVRTRMSAAAREHWQTDLTWAAWTTRTMSACAQAMTPHETRLG